jgi:BlaI family transcriptional regulator, penicillinase repressor
MEEASVDQALTELQLALLRVLWSRGEATVAEVQESLLPERNLAATTVATLLSRLAKRDVVAFRTVGRQYIYRALVTEEQVRQIMADGIAEMFEGDVATLVSHLLNAREVNPADLERVKRLIEAKEAELRRQG